MWKQIKKHDVWMAFWKIKFGKLEENKFVYTCVYI